MKVIFSTLKRQLPPPDRNARNYQPDFVAGKIFVPLIAVFLFCLYLVPHAFAQNPEEDVREWKENIFVFLGGQYYIIPSIVNTYAGEIAEQYGLSDGLIKPFPGFRAGVGYEWRKFRFLFESGYTYIEGTNPLVLDISLIPLLFKTGYVFSPTRQLKIIPALGAGIAFTSVSHYKTVIALLTGNLSHSANSSFMANIGIRAEWVLSWKDLAFYAGIGADAIVETGGIIPLPQAEIGISLHPFKRRAPPKPVEPSQLAAEAEPAAIVSEESKIIPEIISEIIPEEDAAEIPEPVKIRRHAGMIFFAADTAVPAQGYRTLLDETAKALQENPDCTVIIRGYAAPYRSAGGQKALSEERARFCVEYLLREYGIDKERITTEWYGAESMPENIDGSPWMRRSVEIILESFESGEVS